MITSQLISDKKSEHGEPYGLIWHVVLEMIGNTLFCTKFIHSYGVVLTATVYDIIEFKEAVFLNDMILSSIF